MRAMDEAEQQSFLTQGTRTGKLATARADGRPHVVPVWFVTDDRDGTLVFSVDTDTVKAKAMRRDPRVCMCVDDERPPYGFVMIEGTVTLTEDLDELRHWATRIGGRYMGDDQAEAFGRRNAVPGEVLVRLTPTHVVAIAEMAA